MEPTPGSEAKDVGLEESTADVEVVKAKRTLMASRINVLNAKKKDVQERHDVRIAAMEEQIQKAYNRLMLFDEKHYAILHPGFPTPANDADITSSIDLLDGEETEEPAE